MYGIIKLVDGVIRGGTPKHTRHIHDIGGVVNNNFKDNRKLSFVVTGTGVCAGHLESIPTVVPTHVDTINGFNRSRMATRAEEAFGVAGLRFGLWEMDVITTHLPHTNKIFSRKNLRKEE
jgi:hypothetical protein